MKHVASHQPGVDESDALLAEDLLAVIGSAAFAV
jgi:hypothetical protein